MSRACCRLIRATVHIYTKQKRHYRSAVWRIYPVCRTRHGVKKIVMAHLYGWRQVDGQLGDVCVRLRLGAFDGVAVAGRRRHGNGPRPVSLPGRPLTTNNFSRRRWTGQPWRPVVAVLSRIESDNSCRLCDTLLWGHTPFSDSHEQGLKLQIHNNHATIHQQFDYALL